jgi:hypothetical protein
MEKPDKNSSTDEISTYLKRAISAAQFGLPAEEVPGLQELVTEMERRASDWDGS